MSKISIVVPVYYNSDTLMMLYEDMREKILGVIGDYELVFVDDGSGDDSWKVINDIYELDKEHVQCVKLSRNFGEHAALLAGLSVCTGDCAVTKQADLQEDIHLSRPVDRCGFVQRIRDPAHIFCEHIDCKG